MATKPVLKQRVDPSVRNKKPVVSGLFFSSEIVDEEALNPAHTVQIQVVAEDRKRHSLPLGPNTLLFRRASLRLRASHVLGEYMSHGIQENVPP